MFNVILSFIFALTAVFPAHAQVTSVTEAILADKNYAVNGGFENGKAKFSVYKDAAGTAPVDCTGGSPTLSIAASTSSPITGKASGLITKTAADLQGEGVAMSFVTDKAARGKVITISGEYEIGSGTYDGGSSSTNSDLLAYVYDVDTSTLIYPSGNKLDGGVSGNTYPFAFQFQPLNLTSTNYRLCLHQALTGASAYTAKLDKIKVGVGNKSQGPPVTDWQSYTLTIGATTTPPTLGTIARNEARWRRVGDSMEIIYNFYQSTPAGTSGTGTYLFPLPSGYTADTTKMHANTDRNVGSVAGSAAGYSFALGPVSGHVYLAGSTALAISLGDDANQPFAVGSTTMPLSGVEVIYSFTARVPIVGWSSSTIMSSDASTRVVAARYNYASSSNTTVADNSEEILDFGTKVYDTHGAVTTGASWKFTAPVSGYYRVTSHLAWNNTTNLSSSTISVYKNGSVDSELDKTLAGDNDGRVGGTTTLQLSAGDYIDVRAHQDDTSSAARTVGSNAYLTYVAVEQIQGPSQIAASETVAAKYTHTAGVALPHNSSVLVNFANKVFDTHGAVTVGASWKFTAPISGKYQASGCLNMTYTTSSSVSSELNLQSSVNGVSGTVLGVRVIDVTNNSLANACGSSLFDLKAGDYIQFYAFQNTNFAQTLTTSPNTNHISIIRVGN